MALPAWTAGFSRHAARRAAERVWLPGRIALPACNAGCTARRNPRRAPRRLSRNRAAGTPVGLTMLALFPVARITNSPFRAA